MGCFFRPFHFEIYCKSDTFALFTCHQALDTVSCYQFTYIENDIWYLNRRGDLIFFLLLTNSEKYPNHLWLNTKVPNRRKHHWWTVTSHASQQSVSGNTKLYCVVILEILISFCKKTVLLDLYTPPPLPIPVWTDKQTRHREWAWQSFISEPPLDRCPFQSSFVFAPSLHPHWRGIRRCSSSEMKLGDCVLKTRAAVDGRRSLSRFPHHGDCGGNETAVRRNVAEAAASSRSSCVSPGDRGTLLRSFDLLSESLCWLQL